MLMGSWVFCRVFSRSLITFEQICWRFWWSWVSWMRDPGALEDDILIRDYGGVVLVELLMIGCACDLRFADLKVVEFEIE